MAKIYRRLFLIAISALLLTAFPGRTNAQCNVNPGFNFTKSCTQDYRINFTNTSTATPPGQVDYYIWHFGDATTSTANNPSHAYPGGGIYQVILYVYDTSGCYDSVVQNVETTALPQASFSYLQTGCGEISFTNTSTYAGSSPAWFWTFGDGNLSTVENPVHTYATGGIFNVTLTVTDDWGCSNTYLFAINVFDPATVDFTYDQTHCSLVNFFDNSTGTGTITRLWDFGDGTTSTLTNPSHNFILGASYTVTLTISDQYCDSLVHTEVLTFPNLPVANFTFSPDGQCSTVPIDFDASASTGTGLNYSWNFGDGNSVSGLPWATTSHTYSSYNNAACDLTQSYFVALTVSDAIGCTNSTSDVVTTQRIPRPLLMDMSGNDFSNCYSVNPADPTDTLWVNNITPNMGCITHLDIEWGDGSDTLNLTSADFPLSHIYTTMGEFPLTVTAYGTNGCVNDTTYVVANQVNPSVGISGIGANSGCAPYTAQFVLHGYTGNSVGTTYTWDFGDGNSVTWDYNQPYINDTVTHIYTQSHCASGTTPDGYVVSVTANNACGSWTSTIQYVTIFESPQSNFATIDSSDHGCYDVPLCFLNYTYHGFSTSCDSSVNYLWDFGDGSTSTQPEPCHTYAYPGTYQVNLTADNPLCGGSDTTIAMHITGVHADFTFDTACVNSETHFTSLSWAYDDSSFLSNPAIIITDYLWYFGDGDSSNLQNPNHIYPDTGTYTVSLTVTSEYGCDSTIYKDVYVDGIFIDTVLVDSITCYTADDGAITVNTTGGIPTITYNLQPPNITNTNGYFGNLGPGTYWVLVQDAMGCWDETDTIYLTEPLPISVDSVHYTDITCNNDNDGSITAFASGGTNPLSYTLIPPGTTNATGIFTGLAGGTYQVVVEDANGCPADTSAPVTIINPPPVIIDSLQSADITCHNADDGSMQVWAQGGTGMLTYTLNPGGTSNTSGIFTGLGGGTYFVVVTDDNGCADTTMDVDIINPPAIVISNVVSSDMSCHDTLDGSITVTASGGTGLLTYTLMPGFSINGTGAFTGLGAGSFYVRIEDENGCADSTGYITINNPDAIQIDNIVATDITCHNDNDGSITAFASGGTAPLTYTLIPPGISNGTGVFTSLPAGVYQVVVDDSNGCPADTSAPISIINPPAVAIDSIQSMDVSCFNADDGWIQAYASGGTGALTYTLNPSGTMNTTGLFSSLAGGTYTVTVEDANGCNTTSGNITIINPTSVQITNVIYNHMSCHDTIDGSITVTASGGTGIPVFTLLPLGATNTTGVFTNLSAGTYYVRVEDANGCADSTTNITIVNPGEILITNENLTPISCHNANDGIVEVIAGGGNLPYIYTLYPPVVQNGTGLFSGLAPGSYYVIVEDANGCPTDTSSIFTLTNPAELIIDSVQSMDISCQNYNDGWIQVWASGGTGTLTYTLNPPAISNTSGLFSSLAGGTYTVTVTDDHGCNVSTAPIDIINPSSVQIDGFSYTDMSCHDTLDGSITVTASGGTGTPLYTLMPGGSSNTSGVFTGLGANTYYVRVEDGNGCADSTGMIIILNPDEILITSDTVSPISCYNLNDGMVGVTATGGTPPLGYTLLPSGTTNATGEFNGLAAGTYFIVVEDANGCPSDTSDPLVVINPPELIIDSTDYEDITCHDYDDGWVQVWASGGTGMLTYTINPGGVSNSSGYFNSLAAGTYTVTVSDDNGCSTNAPDFTIVNPPGVTAGETHTDVSCFGYNDGTITITASGGVGMLDYSIDNGFTYFPFSNFSGLTPGNYIVRVRDANGCETMGIPVTITEPALLQITGFTTITPTCAGCPDGEITANVIGGTTPYTHSWSNGMSGNPATGLISGWYTDTVTDANGCQTIDSVYLDEPFPITLVMDSSNAICYGDNSGWAAAIVTGGTAPYTYEWTKLPSPTVIGTNDTLYNCDAGFYAVTVYDFFSNMLQDTIEVGQPDTLALSLAFSDTVCFGASNGWATVTAAGGIPPYTYLWSGGSGATTDSIYNLSAGIYTITVTDQNSCVTIDQVEVIENPELIVDATTSDTLICTGFSVQLDALVSGGSLPVVSYAWTPAASLSDPSIANPVATPSVSTTYFIEITDQRGCTATDSITVNVVPSPTADFIYQNPCASNIVNFLNVSSANGDSIVSYDWDFGDGYFSSLQHPTHNYAVLDTTYSVSLIVVNSNGCSDTIIQGVYVNPMLDLVVEADTACIGNPTHFNDTVLNPAAVIVSYFYDFGDGYTDTVPDPVHQYALPGVYNVSVTVEDASGCTEATSFQVQVFALPLPDFADSTSCADNVTYFTDLTDTVSSPVVSWFWDFGDGNTSTLQNPSHLYAVAATYPVTLIVENLNGCLDSITRPVVVFPAPMAEFQTDTVCLGAPSHFIDLSTSYMGVINSWNWDFGDGNTSTLQNPNHFYANPGFYTVELIIGSTTGCTDTISHVAGVYELPEAAFTYTSPCEASPTIFTDLSVANADSLISWYWDFGDGLTSNQQHPQHIFPGGGLYSVNLTVTNSNGCVDDTTMLITVADAPTADFMVDSSPCAGDTTFFTDLSIANVGFLTDWEWDFGDGNTSILQHPTHVYTASGLYDIRLAVTNSLGCMDTITQSVLINPAPVANFTVGSGCMGVPTEFFDLSSTPSGQIAGWYWNFGDPGSGNADTSTMQNPTHIYVFAGVYDVTLIVTNTNGCVDTVMQQVAIHPNPTVGFNFENVCDDDSTLFLDISLPATAPFTQWEWDFGDGTTTTYNSFTDSVYHVFPVSGQYHVTLTVTDSVGCSDSQTRMVVIYPKPTALFAYNQSCVNNLTHFTDYSNGAGSDIVSWYWDFGDPASGIMNNSSLQHPTHQYSVAGDYFVTLWVVNQEGCENQVTQTVTVTPGPVADFEADSTCVGFITFFNNLSYAIGENIISWHWDFGDGTSSILQYPSHAYSSGGTYYVSLTVETENGCVDNVVKPITVNELPVPDFDYSIPNCYPDSTYFTDLSWFIGGNVITAWHWDFGDGSTDTLNQNPVHMYTSPGLYNVTLTTYDTNGCFNSVIKEVYVNPGPTAGFDHLTSSCDSVYFTDQSIGAGAPLISWYWDFGDPASGWNNYSTLPDPMHVFINSGTYDVMLVVTDSLGCTDTLIQTLDIYKPVADFDVSNTCVNSTAQFTDLSYVTGDVIVAWSWNFGDGTTATGSDPTHIYSAPGTYYVSLTVTSSMGCVANVVKMIEVFMPPLANFDHTSACYGETIQFTDLSTGSIISWEWDFGDGNTSTQQNPTHYYTNPGTYTVSLVVTDTNGCFDTETTNLGVFEGPTAEFSANTVCLGQATSFYDESTSSGLPIVEWFWEFGDGDTSSAQNPFHFYSNYGVYTVTLTVTDLGGCEDQISHVVEVYEAPTADFSATAVCLGQPTLFTDLSVPAANISAWFWDFGDPASGMYNFSYEQNPSHVYSLEGIYSVTLTVTDNGGCTHSVTKDIEVLIGPYANFTFTNEHCVDETVLFIDQSGTPTEIITRWIWDFGDGSIDTIYHPANPNIEHIYTSPGQHLVTLTVMNIDSCIGITSKPINILPKPIASFYHTNACEDMLIQFTDNTNQNGGGQIINWWWDFGDPLSGATNNSQLPNPSHIFTGTGDYLVTLIVWNDNSCRDTVEQIVTVKPSPPVDFYWENACEGSLTQFFADDSVMNVNTIVDWQWDFGDGTYSNLQDPTHMYPAWGTYEVTLTVTDTSLCEGSITRDVTVDKLPVAFFDISEPTCNGDSVFFDDQSSTTWGYIQTWVWDYDDGSPLDTIHFPGDPNVFHTYTDPGTYGATLTVINSGGCSHSFMREVHILETPIANFHWSANPCQYEEVQFTDASFPNGQGNILSWFWEFDDPMSGINNTSVQQNPVHIFSQPGVYNVILIVENFNNCTDTIVKPISVNASPDVAFGWGNSCEDTLTYFWPDSANMSPETITSWYWDFGDGQFSTEPSPAHNYENTGYYNVTLTVQDTGVCTHSLTQEIYIDEAPLAFFDVSEITCMGNPVYFDDLSSVGASYIIEWHWDFGDGTDTTIYFPDEPDVEHTYAMDGTYPVTLTVVSADSCYGDEMMYVVIDASPIALFNYDPACYGTPTQFWDNSSGGGGLTITSWYWDFGDPQSGVNNTSTLQNPEHVYTEPGTYDVILTVNNVGGCIDTVLQQVVVNDGIPVDFWSADSCLNMLTFFYVDTEVTDTNAVILYEWDFGDGSPLEHLMNPSHMYDEAGIYNAMLTIYDTSGCSNSIIHEVEVRDNPVALFEYEAACANDTAYFTDLSYTLNGDLIIDWYWDFNDPASGAANFSSLQHPMHVFTGMNNYDVKLVVTTNHGCQDSIVIPVAASSTPESNFTFQLDPCSPGLVYFSDSSQALQSPIVEWEWYMEPGSYSYIPDPYHIFLETDTTYLVSLTVTDANGCSDEMVKEIYVPEGFEVALNSTQTCFEDAMHFSASILAPAQDSIFSYSWDFGEPASGPYNYSNLPQPEHTYLNSGYYTVSLTAEDIHGCMTTVYKQVLVDMLPDAVFEYSGALCDSTLYFTDLSVGNGAEIESWLWDFGDGSVPQYIELPPGNTDHFYAFEGTYPVTLTVTNANGCSNSVTMDVERDPCLNSDFFVVNNAICERNTITFADSSGVDFLIEQWQWNFGDGQDTLYHVKSDTVSHYYATAGNYEVSLVVSAIFNDVLIADTFARTITVHPTPQPGFFCEPVCFGESSHFMDNTQHPGSYIESYSWNFGTGSPEDTSSYKNPVFHYDSAGIYNVELITYNQYGCYDSVRQEAKVDFIPIADFEYSAACEGDKVYFTDLSDGFDSEIVSWNWNFNDPILSGDTSSMQHPSWTYGHQGTNAVSLIVRNENGCLDTTEIQITVNDIPHAEFLLHNNHENMQGSILLEDLSEDGIEYLWDFGDGYEEWNASPPVTHIYEEDGEYPVSLVIWNEYGCTDSALMNYEFMFKTLYIPNALAPSSHDPEVKVFQPKGRNLDEFYIAIHDSWGNLLWESDKLDALGRPAEYWDGTYDGKLLPTDVYIWRARAVFKDGSFWEGNVVGNTDGSSGKTHGTVTLVR